MMPPGASLVGPPANMIPSQSSHQPPAMFNPAATTNSGVQLQGQPPYMTSVSKPPQAGMFPPPPPSSTGPPGPLQHNQFPPPPKAGTQANVGQSMQQLPMMPNRFPSPPTTGTHPPVNLPPQQGGPPQQGIPVTSALPKTETQTVGPHQQRPIHSMPMSGQSQPNFGGLSQPSGMLSSTGPPLQSSSTNQFSGQSAMGTVQAAPPMMSARQPIPNITSNAFTGGPQLSRMHSSNTGPPTASHVGTTPSGTLPSTGIPGNLLT